MFRHVLPMAALVFLLLGVLPASAGDVCLDEIIADFLHVNPATSKTDIERFSEIALGRRLHDEELEALAKATKVGAPDLLSPAEVKSQVELLSGHFSPDELARLRRFGILGNSVEPLGEEIPLAIVTSEVKARPFGRVEAAAVRRGDKVHYFIDADDHLHIAEGELKFPKDEILVLKDPKDGQSYLVKEAGTMKWNAKLGKPEPLPEYSSEMVHEDPDALLARLRKENPDLEVNRPKLPEQARAKFMECREILASQGSMTSFVKDKLLIGNAISMGGIVVVQAPEVLSGDAKRREHALQVAKADITSNNAGLFVSTLVGAGLFKVDAGPWLSLGVRTATSLGMTEAQKPIYNAMVDPDLKPGSTGSVANRVAAFDKGHSLARIPINYAFDYYMLKVLPLQLFEACSRGAHLSVWLSPKMIRIYERGVSTLIYRGARKVIADE